MLEANLADYVRSQGEELRARATRVRQLIGDSHWGRDGQHKEELLGEMLQRHLPGRLVALPGFVVSADTFPSGCSREQDIVVWDGYTYPWLMRSNHLAIGFPDACAASISIKTSIDRDEFMDMWATLASIPASSHEIPKVGFVYNEHSFPKNVDTVYSWFLDAINASKDVHMHYLATADGIFARVDKVSTDARIRIFQSNGASFGLLMSCLMQDLGDRRFDLSVALDAVDAKPLGEFKTASLL